MPIRRFEATAAAVLLIAGLSLAGVASAQRPTTWKDHKSECIRAFGEPAKADVKKLLVCADQFNAEARLFALSASDKSAAEKGLRHLYENGDDTGAQIAREGLFRLGIKLPPRAASGDQPVAAAEAPARKRYDPPEARAADRAAAQKLAKAGVSLLKKKKYAPGTSKLTQALEKDPRSEFVLYNLACGEANLGGRRQDALTRLQHLADLGTDESLERLIKARSDEDFVDLRDDVDFKRITGYARIQVVNTIGRPGEKAVVNIEKLLDKLGHRKADSREVDKPLQEPVVEFKPHAKAQVALLAELLNHPRTRLEPMQGDSKYDIVIRWGSKVEKVDGDTKVESFGPETVDDSIADARRRQNKVLAQPEAAINKVDRVVSTPERAYGEVENMGKRVEGTANKAKGTLDKMKSLGDKVHSL